MVRIQAHMILRATPHFTVLVPMVVPTPMMDVQMIWVVLTGIPRTDAPMIVEAPAVSAANPWTGRSLVILYPIVLTIRHPPESVPSAIAAWAARITHNGTGRWFGSTDVPKYPMEKRSGTMIPMVFWASFVPWLKLYAAAEKSWSRLKCVSADCLFAFLVRLRIAAIKRNPQVRPIRGETTMKRATCPTVDHFIAVNPAAEIPAPVIPPIRAWEDEVGRPENHVIRFHEIAPISAPRMIYGTIIVSTISSWMILLMVLATATPKPNAAIKLKKAAKTTAFRGDRTLVETTVEMEFAE